jgi:hypothetical protein
MSSIKVATAMIFGKYEAKPLVLSLSLSLSLFCKRKCRE